MSFTIEDIQATFGVTVPETDPTPPATDPVVPTTDPTPPVTDPVPPTPAEPPATDPVPPVTDPAPPAPTQEDKQRYAFQELRLQNQNLNRTLQSLAEILKIPVKDLKPDEVVGQLEQKLIEAQAKQQNVSPELLLEMNQLRQTNYQLQVQTQEHQVALGFQKVMDTFKLDEKALNAFSEELVKAGINPYTQQVNLVDQYRLMHMDDIVAAKVQAAMVAEQERLKKVAEQSTTPNTQVGAPTSTGDGKIKTMADLEAVMAAYTGR